MQKRTAIAGASQEVVKNSLVPEEELVPGKGRSTVIHHFGL